MHGPQWLPTKSDWLTWTPTSALHLQTEEEDVESEVTYILKHAEKHEGVLSVIDISRYSHIHQLLAVTAYVLRWVHNLCKSPKISGPLTSVELTNARKHLIKSVQCSVYQEELAYLLKKQSKCLPLFRQLHLFLDNK